MIGDFLMDVKTMDVKTMVRYFLQTKLFDGLFCEAGDCACVIDDIAPCGECLSENCEAGYLAPCPHDCGEHDWHIQNDMIGDFLMDVKTMVRYFLQTKLFDGLFCEAGDCACVIDDIAPCGECLSENCEAGYLAPCPPDCGEHDWHIQKERFEFEATTETQRSLKKLGVGDFWVYMISELITDKSLNAVDVSGWIQSNRSMLSGLPCVTLSRVTGGVRVHNIVLGVMDESDGTEPSSTAWFEAERFGLMRR